MIIKEYVNAELGIKAVIHGSEESSLVVSVVDTDVDLALPTVKIFPASMRLEAHHYARKVAGVELSEELKTIRAITQAIAALN